MLEFLNDKLDGNTWEDLCDKCYRLKYQDYGYQYVPAQYRGDFGIEGYTSTGIVYQCYYPEKEYSDNELYECQRDKVTRDIKKLLKNGENLKSIGVNKVKEWHFVIPEYKDKRLLQHCEDKRREVLKEKKVKKLDYIDDDFKILVKVEKDFSQELHKILYIEKDMKLNLAIKHTGDIDWSKCPSDKVANIKRKIKAIMYKKNDETWDDRYKRIVNRYIDYYVKGMELINRLKISCPEFYEKLFEIENTCRDEVGMKCDLNDDSTINMKLFQNIINDFEKTIKDEFGEQLTITSIAEIKNDLISSWLADCPMDFR